MHVTMQTDACNNEIVAFVSRVLEGSRVGREKTEANNNRQFTAATLRFL